MEPLERLWNDLLSRDERLIQQTFESISPMEQQMIVAHLQKMVSEEGWQKEQIDSAAEALSVIRKNINVQR